MSNDFALLDQKLQCLQGTLGFWIVFKAVAAVMSDRLTLPMQVLMAAPAAAVPAPRLLLAAAWKSWMCGRRRNSTVANLQLRVDCLKLCRDCKVQGARVPLLQGALYQQLCEDLEHEV